MRLGLSLGIVYRVGAEGLLRAELGLYRLGGAVPMQLLRGGRLGSQPTYAAPWIWVQKSRLYENSDLTPPINHLCHCYKLFATALLIIQIRFLLFLLLLTSWPQHQCFRPLVDATTPLLGWGTPTRWVRCPLSRPQVNCEALLASIWQDSSAMTTKQQVRCHLVWILLVLTSTHYQRLVITMVAGTRQQWWWPGQCYGGDVVVAVGGFITPILDCILHCLSNIV